jgi:hypothetical protein
MGKCISIIIYHLLETYLLMYKVVGRIPVHINFAFNVRLIMRKSIHGHIPFFHAREVELCWQN